MTTVVALGGNALIRQGERGTAAEQRARLRETATALSPLFGAGPLVLTHGNGPQVGNELVRQERAADEVPPLPLYLAVAQTQAEIGALIALELSAVAGASVACVLTRVTVDPSDAAFERPTKPIGPFYDEQRATTLERERGWTVVEEQGRGYRRAVASPLPLEIVELGAIRTLLADGTIVIACGGGGIPVAERDGRHHGIDAVIDKDRASALLARCLGARRLLIVTDVPGVIRRFGEAGEEPIIELSRAEGEALLPELGEGSMRPKVEAALEFVGAGGEAVITSLEGLPETITGSGGTRIVA